MKKTGKKKLPPLIMVVEDEELSRTLIIHNLAVAGWRTLAAESGESALPLLQPPYPDLILLDILLPGMNGFDLCRQIKAGKNTGHIPIIFITAMPGEEGEAKGFAAGAVDFIHKPITPSVLKARIGLHLELKRHREELEIMVAERTAELLDALKKIKTLRGLLPLCASCMKIRDEKGLWKQIDVYIQNHSEAEFTHGICPDCARKLYPDLYDDI